MTLAAPYPEELLRIAKKVVWYDAPEQTLANLQTFLTHLMVYGSPAKVVRALTAEEQSGLKRWAEKYVAVAKAHAALDS
jgi:carbonic anhydrase/acetyltransferase-like protein (isoleucine patch superfamily)